MVLRAYKHMNIETDHDSGVGFPAEWRAGRGSIIDGSTKLLPCAWLSWNGGFWVVGESVSWLYAPDVSLGSARWLLLLLLCRNMFRMRGVEPRIGTWG